MANLLEIKTRIRSVKNIRQVTKAMEMVAASKMRRAQDRALKSRKFSDTMSSVLDSLHGRVDATLHPLLESRVVKTALVVYVGSDRGLCGALPSNLVRYLISFENATLQKVALEYVTVQKKSHETLLRANKNILADFHLMGDHPTLSDVRPIAKLVTDGYMQQQFDAVYLLYMDFETTLSQLPKAKQILPLGKTDEFLAFLGESTQDASIEKSEFVFEPDANAVLAALIPQYIETQIYQSILETQASEQSARMVAMKNATENAGEIQENLTLDYNRTRQAVITQEISEIVAGS